MLIDFFKNATGNDHPVTTGNGTDYLHSVVLTGIEDHFNASQLWHRPLPMMGAGGRAKGFVAAHPYVLGANEYVHAHVCIEIPPQVMAWDRNVANGELSAGLAHELASLHTADFGKRLQPGSTPRYTVLAGHDLPVNGVRIRIGHAVYVPGKDEPMAWRLEGSHDGIIFEPLGELGQMQRLSLLGANMETASIPVRRWLWGDRHSVVIINNPEGETLSFNADPYGSLDIQHDDAMGHYVIGKPGGKDSYILRAQRLIQAQPMPKRQERVVGISMPEITSQARIDPDLSNITPECSVIQFPRLVENESVLPVMMSLEEPSAQPASDHLDDGTFLPDLHTLQQQPRMTLVGLALQRVSLYKGHGVSSMGIGFDRNGQLHPPHDPHAQVSFLTNARDQILVATGNGRRPVNAGERLPLGTDASVLFEDPPEPMRDIYLAFCRLPVQASDPVGIGACFSVGRDKPVLKGLRPLSRKGFIEADARWSGADRMGLSRMAFAMEVTKEGLSLTRIGENQALYHLDPALALTARIDKDTPQPYAIPVGHHLVAGPYIWRFEA